MRRRCHRAALFLHSLTAVYLGTLTSCARQLVGQTDKTRECDARTTELHIEIETNNGYLEIVGF